MSEPFDRALRAAARRSRPAGLCPDAAMLASYADNGLSEDERRGVEAHAADCATCLEHLTLLGALSLDRDVREPSRSWLAQWGWLVPVATAVLVVAVWIRLPEQPEQKASQDARAMPAPAPQVKAPVAREQERAAALRESVGQDKDANQSPRIGAKVSRSAPARPAPLADAKLDQLTPLERRDTARQKTASTPPTVASAPPTAPPVQAQEAGAEKVPVLLGGASDKRASPTAAAAAPPRATTVDAIKEEVKLAETGRRREADLLKSARATSAPPIVSASPKELYRAVGNRIELSEDGGATWRVAVSVSHVTFTAAACAPGGPCWFGTSFGTIVRLVPHGKSSLLPSRSAVQSIVLEKPLGAVVTIEGGQRFRTADGGATWQPIP